MKPVQKFWLILFGIWAYAGWFFCVIVGKLELGPLALLGPAVSWLLFYFALRPDFGLRIKLLFLSVIGLAFDALALKLDWISTPAPSSIPAIWLVSLWLHFTPSIVLLKSIFETRLLLGSFVGAILGPLSYKSGEAFQVLSFSNPMAPYWYALFWAGFLPGAILWISENRKKTVNENT